MKNKKAYIIYEYNQFQNDYRYIKEYHNTSEIVKDYKLKNKKSIYHYINKNIDKLKNNKLLNDRYIIIQDIL